jgi:type IV pilus assembly protein PilV
MRMPSPAPQAERGFTLLEVLVALAILAIGMLGVIAALVAGLRASRDASLQNAAVTLAADLADSIRANRAGAAAYALAAGTVLETPPVTCSVVGECGAIEIAAVDLHAWQQRVLETLPEAVTNVTVTAVTDAVAHLCTISIHWTQTGRGVPSSFAITVQT